MQSYNDSINQITIPVYKEGCNVSEQNSFSGDTVALRLARYKIIPPKEWEHDPNIQNKEGWTVMMYLCFHHKPLLKQWRHDPNIQNEKGNTVAMMLAARGIIPPKQWQHHPKLINGYGQTVSMILANCKIVLQKNLGGKLSSSGKYTLGEWSHDPDLNFGSGTVAIYLSQNGIIPPKEWEHFANIRNWTGNTVAINLAARGIIPPKQWEHNSSLQDRSGYTVAMYLAKNKIQIPKEWEHDPSIKNLNNELCREIMEANKMVISSFWKADHQQYINYINRSLNLRYINLLKVFPSKLKILKIKQIFHPIIGEEW